jgi:uncharacterized membrane protein YagU involved in acid resistance
MVMLEAATILGIPTAHGGLLRLTETALEQTIRLIAVVKPIAHHPILPVASPWFQNLFHVATGLLMAIVYVFIVEPRLPGGAFGKGLTYGAAAWLFNSFVVLPLIGEGPLGIHHLRVLGIICFAVAHLAFFVTLSLTFRYLRRNLSGEPTAL